MRVRRAEFPDTFTEHLIGDPWERPHSSIVKKIMDRFTGPNCIGGVTVDYRRIRVAPYVTRSWPRTRATVHPNDAGPPISPLRWSTRRHATCMSISAHALAEVEAVHGREEIRHGVVRLTRAGDVVAGLLPPYASFGTYAPYNESDETITHSTERTLLCRTGPYVTEVAAPALYLMGRLLVPIKTNVLEENVPIDRATAWTYNYRTPIV